MYSDLKEVINVFRLGATVVVVDEHREFESDLIFAAQFASEERVTFMVNNTSGILCVPMGEEYAKKLELPLMVQNNNEKHETNFTVSVDAIDPTMHTGVTSHDRTLTIKKILGGNPNDLARPGHMFPLIAKNSLFERSGHTEASVTLCRLAGLKEIAVICELVNRDGTTMNKEQTLQFANDHNLYVISIKQLMSFLRA